LSFPLVVGDDLEVPLRVHGSYSMSEIMGGFGVIRNGRLLSPQTGVFWHPETKTDLLFVTLQKSEAEYSPKTLYRDYPLSETLFHWESQHHTAEDSTTGQRYIHHVERGSHVVLFVRHQKKIGGVNQPYVCLGRAKYVRHQDERPMQITWELERPMPGRFFEQAKVAAG
ncbi:MAG: DUF3427 domain-containing protein, partial [Myxococcales bacterium]|nr:DUF3427 domain-containing protein [Myxococcales bacterium]